MAANDHTPVVLLGYSGHGLVVAEAALLGGMQLEYYAELQPATANPFGLTYLGFEGANDFQGWGKGYAFILGIGDNKVRAKVAKLVMSKGEKLLNVIHPDASVSTTVRIGQGVLVARHASVNPMASIGDGAIINTGSIVEHDCIVSRFVHVAPGAVLCGNVTIGEGSFIGAGSVVRQGINIGKDALAGAGAVIIKDIPDTQWWAGNPARKIK